MTKGGMKVAKQAEDMDLIKEEEEDPQEGTVITLPIMKKEVKVHNPQEKESGDGRVRQLFSTYFSSSLLL